MKKNFAILLALAFVGSIAVSCKKQGTCAAYPKSAKVKSETQFVNKTEKNS
jgi:hypothetical protein